MKILEENIVKGESRKEVIQKGKKKFVRIASPSGIDWRRHKTNHQVKKIEFDSLEKEYNRNFPLGFVPAEFMKRRVRILPTNKKAKTPFVELSLNKDELIRKLMIASDNGERKLAGVKFIKEETGWGLRDAKDFVDTVFAMRKVKKDFENL